jgi:RNA polymerase sigma-70 factor (ECF subfamily)
MATTTLLTPAPAVLPVSADAPPPDEARLIAEAVGPNPRAFDELVRLHSRRVFNFLLQMTRQRQDAEDLAQQTFIKAFHNLHRFEPGRPLINWLLTIARRTALNHFRAAKKWEEVPEELASAGPSPARAAEQGDQTDSLWARARRQLSQREFEVMWLRFAEEMSVEETARVAGLTQTHVKVIIFRARRRLMKGESKL